jgi:hypothetical protein
VKSAPCGFESHLVHKHQPSKTFFEVSQAGELDCSALGLVSHVQTRQNSLNFVTVVTYTLSRLFTRLTGKAVAEWVRLPVIDVTQITAAYLTM